MECGLRGAGRLEGGKVNEGARRRGDPFPGEAPVGSDIGGVGGGSGREGARCCGERHGGVDVMIASSPTTLPGCRNRNCKQASWQQRKNGKRREGGAKRIQMNPENRRRKGAMDWLVCGRALNPCLPLI